MGDIEQKTLHSLQFKKANTMRTPTIVLITDHTDSSTRLSKKFVCTKKYVCINEEESVPSNSSDPLQLTTITKDIINHLEKISSKEAPQKGKAIIISTNDEITTNLYKNILSHLGRRSSSFDEIKTTNYAQYFTNHFGHPKEWHKTNLPHRNKKHLIQFITFRQADSLPQTVLKMIEKELKHLTNEKRDIEKRIKHQYWLDKGLGSCALAQLEMAQIVQQAFLHHNGVKYDLLAWSIMPNHVHVLIKTNHDLPKIIQSWKSFTGKWALANNIKYHLGLDTDATQFWMADYWDRFIRDEDHFNAAVRYTLNNPVKAKLPDSHIAYLFRGMLLDLDFGMKQELHPTQVKMVRTRDKGVGEDLWKLLGIKDDGKELDRSIEYSLLNSKVAIVVDV